MLQDNKHIYALPFFIELPKLTNESANGGMNKFIEGAKRL